MRACVRSARGVVAVLLVGWVMGLGCTVPPKASVPSRDFVGRTRVACIGDSITAGAGLADPANAAYPAVLAQLLGPSYEVRNFGVSGSTMLRDGDLPYYRTKAYQEAREWLPHIVVIALGTNDSKPQNWRHRPALERDTYAMMREFLSLPSLPTVYLCLPPPVFTDRWGINQATVKQEIVPSYRRWAARENWPVIDLQTALRSSGSQFPDGVHPDAVGAAAIANSVDAAFRGR